nr:hypothetical protein [Tanacetum cinerariifolium]
DTGCGTHICNTLQGLRESKKLKHGALSLYMGNKMRAAVKAIRSFDLILPIGLIIILDYCHFAPYITMGVDLVSYLVNNGYIHTFTNYGIFVSKYNVFYFNAIPRDGIYEIDMHNLYPNASNKRVTYSLDSSYLWHCCLGHINKKYIDKLQRDRMLQRTHDESFEKFKSFLSGKMACKPFPYQVERAKDLFRLIHTDDKKKPRGAKGKDIGKNKLAYDPKPKISPPPKRDNMEKDSVCHPCEEVGHWRRNCSSYQAELKNASVASTSGS